MPVEDTNYLIGILLSTIVALTAVALPRITPRRVTGVAAARLRR